MRLIKLAWANLGAKPFNTALSVLLLAFGVGIISLLLVLEHEVQQKFERNISNIDMVLGASGSPIQLILSSVYQVDAPTGNIPFSQARKLDRNLYVQHAIPISSGDNYGGYRIIGTSKAYTKLYEATLSSGDMWSGSMEAVVGADVAKATGLKLGDTFASSHGFDSEGEAHGDQLFTVVGLLEKNRSVIDQLILTNLQSVWDVHGDHANDSTEVEREITALLISLRKSEQQRVGMGLATIPLIFKDEEGVQLVQTSIIVNKLTQGFGIGVDTLRYLAYAIIFLSCASLFISLYNSLKERRYEIAVMRTMGGSPPKMFVLLLLEGVLITSFGIIAGLVLSRLGIFLLSERLEKEFHYDISRLSLLPNEWLLVLGMLGIGILASLLPAIQAIRIDISKTLADE